MPAPNPPSNGVLTTTYLSAVATYINDLEARMPLSIRKTVNGTAVNASTTLVDDNELVFNVGVGTYWINGRGKFIANASADFKPGFGGTATFTMDYSIFGFIAGAAFGGLLYTELTFAQVDGASANDEFLVDGQLYVTAAGTFTCRYAQFASHASDAYYLAGTRFTLTRVN